MNREASLATCSRRIDIGICSPLTAGRPRPSQRANTYSSAVLDARAQAQPGGELLGDLAHRFQRFPCPRAGVGDHRFEHLRPNLRRPAEPDEGAVELEHLVRTWWDRSGRRRPGGRCRPRTVLPPRARWTCTRRRAAGRRSRCRRARPPRHRRARPRRTARTAERTACSSGCPVPRSVATDSAATSSAARIGCSARSLRHGARE